MIPCGMTVIRIQDDTDWCGFFSEIVSNSKSIIPPPLRLYCWCHVLSSKWCEYCTSLFLCHFDFGWLQKPSLLAINSLRPVTPYAIVKICHHWCRQLLVTCPPPSHYMNQRWFIVDWTLSNELHWNCNTIAHISTLENALEIAVWKIIAISYRPQCVIIKKCFVWVFRDRSVVRYNTPIAWWYGMYRHCLVDTREPPGFVRPPELSL